MTRATIKKQVDHYLPLLTDKQQVLVLDMIKSLLNVDDSAMRISRKEYNKEINDALGRIEKGQSVSHSEALKRLSKW
ncbi:MAG: hypothetical protein ACK500_09995 [Flavobacteriales bacterium]|jgi:hypothetical protein